MRIFILLLTLILMTGTCAFAEAPETIKPEPIRFEFNEGMEGWDIPDWAFEQGNYVNKSIEWSDEKFSKGTHSLKLDCDFPGDFWTAAIIELSRDMDLSGYKTISADVFLPRKARGNIYLARIILVVGPWWWLEERESTVLRRNRWVTIKAKIDINKANELLHWKRKTKDSSLVDNINNVRKINIRIECNANEGQIAPRYKGPVYIDNIVIE